MKSEWKPFVSYDNLDDGKYLIAIKNTVLVESDDKYEYIVIEVTTNINGRWIISHSTLDVEADLDYPESYQEIDKYNKGCDMPIGEQLRLILGNNPTLNKCKVITIELYDGSSLQVVAYVKKVFKDNTYAIHFITKVKRESIAISDEEIIETEYKQYICSRDDKIKMVKVHENYSHFSSLYEKATL